MAVNPNEGVLSLVGPAGPEVMVTAGAVVSTVKDSAVLWPVFPAPSDWKARAVWVPSARASASGTDVDQMPEPSTAMPG